MVASSPWLDIHYGREVRDDGDEVPDQSVNTASESHEGTGADGTETENEAQTHPWEHIGATGRPSQTDADSPSPPTDQPADD